MIRKKKLTTLKVKFLHMICAILIPQAIFLFVYSSNMLQEMNERIAQSQKATLSLLANDFETQITSAENTLADIALNNEAFRQLGVTEDEVKSYFYSYDIFSNNESLFSDNSDIIVMATYNNKNGLLYTAYGLMPAYSVDDRISVIESIERSINDIMKQGQVKTNRWFPLDTGERIFYCRFVSYNDAYYLCLFDFQHMALNAKKGNGIVGQLVFSLDEQILNQKEWIKEYQVKLESNEGYYITQGPKRQFVVQSQINRIRLSYLTEYNGTLRNMTMKQIQFLGISLLSLLAFPIAYIYIKQRVLKPMDRLVLIMRTIRDGNLETVADWEYRTAEFYVVNDTFNEMISQIKQLKIESYEKQIAKERANLQALRLQIRQHFFLNCLKTLYGLSEVKRYDGIQQYIILLSKHLRYIFQDNANLVKMEKELTSCQNYISLQKYNLNNPPDYTVNIDARVLKVPIPPITLLTMIENSVKHGTQIGSQLKITMTIVLLPSDDGDLVNITIHDNGPGFKTEMLQKLNSLLENSPENEHVGLINVIRRFQLIYGNQFGIAFSNRNGATVDIFFNMQYSSDMNVGDCI